MLKEIVIGIFIAVVSGLILFELQSPSKQLNHYSYEATTLTISATNSNIEIHESKNNVPYKGGNILSSTSNQIIYLPKGQLLTVNIIATNSNLKISESIADQVNVNNTSTNSDVSIF